MYEKVDALFEGRASVLEERLRALLDAGLDTGLARREVIVELDETFIHGRQRGPQSVVDVVADPQVHPEVDPAGPIPTDCEAALPDPDPDPDSAEGSVPAEGEAGCPAAEELVPGAAALGRLFTAGMEHLDRARQSHAQLARAAAGQARALAAFARSRPAGLDRCDEQIGAAAAATRAARPAVLTAVSEWAVDEVMVALALSSDAASKLLVDAVTLDERLPATLAALEQGRISWVHAQVVAELIGRLGDEVRPVAEQRLLARVGAKTSTQLRVAARRVVQRCDAEGIAERVTQAIRERRVTVYPGEDGMGTLSAVLPVPVARAVEDALGQYADAAAVPGDQRTKAERMVDCLVDLVLRPGEHGLAPVQARLTVVAAVETLLGGDEPGEVDGDLVPAVMVRELAAALGLMPPTPTPVDMPTPAAAVDMPADPVDVPATPVDAATSADVMAPVDAATPADAATPTGAVHVPTPADEVAPTGQPEVVSPDLVESSRAALAALLKARYVTGTALLHRPHIAVIDELSGQLLALTDAVGLRSGQGLGPPPESPGYRPAEELDRFVRLRDRRCRFPGCRARPIRCDLDHTIEWPWGPTSAGNLCCLCRHHHRLSHQAPGWRLRGLPDGGLQWRTPTGQVATTYPPQFGADDDLPPAWAEDDLPPVWAGPPEEEHPDPGERPGTESADPDPPPF